ncbi:outer membrane protein transport protein [uncultured Thiodictyon sp.]|uniref:OmpP1/FadL family transporter n=1 Tax=uncultured Thiodictyon sp. TaxID=1846217 RepID=UPI0025CFC12F|nr:outer membrane protein transport protein [uncultured Thiodictyon sp.]
MSLSRISAVSLGLGCALAVTGAQATNGYMSHAYSPAAKAMAGAGEATLALDSLSIVGNPATLAKLGRRLDLGLAWFSPSRKYQGVAPNAATGAYAPIGSGSGTGSVTSQNDNFLIPSFGYVHPLDAKSAVGLALFGNGGMNTDYRSGDTLFNLGTYGGNNGCANPPHNPGVPCGAQVAGTSLLGGGNTGVNLSQLGIALGYGRRVMDNLSLGASLLIGYQTIEVRGAGAFQGFTQAFTQSMIANGGRSAASPANLTNRGVDSAWGAGLQLGALWDITPQWTLGLSLRSKTYMSKFKKYSDLLAEGGDLDVPASGVIGLAFKPNNRLTLALDVQQIWYSDVPAIGNRNQLAQRCDVNAAFGPTASGSTYNPSYCLGGSNGAGFGWRDMTILKLGVQYAVTDTLTLRAGYSHGNQIVRSQEIAFNTLTPAVIQDHWTLGATYRLRKQYELTFWGMYAPERSVSGPGAFTGTQSASISMSQFELGLSFGWLID